MRGVRVEALFLLSALAATVAPAAVFDVQWAPELALRDLSQAAQRLREPFDSPVTLRRAGQSVRSAHCISLLQYRKSGFKPISDRDTQVVQSLAVDCMAIQSLESARPSGISFLRTFRLDQSAMTLLPPALAPVVSDEDRANIRSAASRGLSWRQFDPSGIASIEGDALAVTADDMRTLVKIYGRGDFNRDGIDDLLVRVDTAALHGTYRASRLLMLTKTSANTPIRVTRELI